MPRHAFTTLTAQSRKDEAIRRLEQSPRSDFLTAHATPELIAETNSIVIRDRRAHFGVQTRAAENFPLFGRQAVPQ
jgi:hypothetical protein